MAIIKTIQTNISEKFGKGRKYPVSKFEKQLEIILKHQEKRMIEVQRMRKIVTKLEVVTVKKSNTTRMRVSKKRLSVMSTGNSTVLCCL
jgi:hypothetical protein